MNLERNVLIVDDSHTVDRDIKQYNYIFDQMREDLQLDYIVNFVAVSKYDEALDSLTSSKCVIDVLMTDYDLSTSGNKQNGIDLVTQVRGTVNRHCKIIFYTMGELTTVFSNRLDLIKLFNKGIYRFLPKDLETENPKIYGSKPHQLRVEAIVEAINDIDYIQVTLERYFVEYSTLVPDEKIFIDGKGYLVHDIINFIRQDDPVGQMYKSNLLKSVILHNLLTGGNEK